MALYIVIIHREMPKMGVINRLRMHNLVIRVFLCVCVLNIIIKIMHGTVLTSCMYK